MTHNTNLTSSNIRKGVNVGGVVGTAPRAASGSGTTSSNSTMSATVGFKPSIIVVQVRTHATGAPSQSVYGAVYNNVDAEYSRANKYHYEVSGSVDRVRALGSDWTITSTGFSVRLEDVNNHITGNKPFIWAAFE